MSNGWVKLHRKLFENKLWLSEPFTKAQAWVDLFANANHEKGSFWIRGNEVVILRGQIGWSELTMASRWSWSKNKVRRFLKWLETEQQVKQQKSHLTTVLTILNYDKFQTLEETKQQAIQQKDSRRYTNKNDKKNKNDKNKERDTSEATASPMIGEVIKAFEGVNPSYRKFFANTTQRAATQRLLETHGEERLLRVISFLPKSNVIPYIPVITSPLQLEDNWGKLEAGLQKKKNEQITRGRGLI